MALLHYANLGLARPEKLLDRAFYGLRPFYEFLKRTKTYLESDEAVQRLAWEAGTGPDEVVLRANEDAQGPCWVRLVEPEDLSNVPDATFRAFLDESVREVYESEEVGDAPETPSARGGRRKFVQDRRVGILQRDSQTYQLLLERRPESSQLLLRPNTYALQKQIDALQALQNSPSRDHVPLLQLLQTARYASWPDFEVDDKAVDDWMVLRDASRPGTSEQRHFVAIALATLDFAILEGPPGSGKTTAICELVLQLVKRGKRVLLCASTHIAVDNVLERLMGEQSEHRDLIIPVRIGDGGNGSDQATQWQLGQFVETERKRLLRELGRCRSLTAAQQALLEALRQGVDVIQRLVLDAANLVCGTTIGILQHPDIKQKGADKADYDVLIVDEASKTTFQEFLVPAMLAKRWIIVGDPRQLSPYVDEEAMEVNVEACLPDKELRDACLDVFIAGRPDPHKRRVTVVATDDAGLRQAYERQAEARGVDFAVAGAAGSGVAALVVGSERDLKQHLDILPLDVAHVRAPEGCLPSLRRRALAWIRRADVGADVPEAWAAEVAWRLSRHYDQRLQVVAEGADSDGKTTEQKLRQQIEDLLPAEGLTDDAQGVAERVEGVRRVGLPSILESLKEGFSRGFADREGSALTDGLPVDKLRQRHVRLSTQHRMHADIAAFSHEWIYGGGALNTPASMETARHWSYGRYDGRAIWLECQGGFEHGWNANGREARLVVDELRMFDEWAQKNPRSDGHPWEVAVLTFYRGQEHEIRGHLQRWSALPHNVRRFWRGERVRPYLKLELCTVDRFQGHEADLVFLSFASSRPTSFLESPNRLNVALTRARYQRVIIGDRKAMARARRSLLGRLAVESKWEQSLPEGKQ